MKFTTAVIHAGEGYVPDSLQVVPHDPKVEGYGYNEGYEETTDDVVIEADNLDASYALWLEYAIGCSHIRGADDDHYDYFPSNFDALVHLGHQIDEVRGTDRCMLIARMIWHQLARQRWNPLHETLDQAFEEFSTEIVTCP